MILPSLSGGGIERVVITLSETLHKLGHTVHIVLFHNTIEFTINPNITIHILEKKTPKHLKKLIDTIEKSEATFDYIYAHYLGGIVKKAKLHNRYYIFHTPLSIRLKNGNFLQRVIRKQRLKLRYKNENIITVSKGIEEDFIKQGFKSKTITTIYNPFNFESILENAKVQDKDIPKEEYIIHVARLENISKRQDILIQAFAKSGLDCKLLLVGKGSRKETSRIKNLIKELNLEEQVLLIGFKANPFPLIKHAKLFVLSSDFEGFGMVLVESLFLNTPIVSTNCPTGPSEIMQGELANYLVPIRDINALAKKIYEAFTNPPKIEAKFLEQFDAHNIAKKYLSLKENRHE
jgi:glycosyltransferase involved in cell wall biosynthesis